MKTAEEFIVMSNDSDFRLSKSGLYLSEMMNEYALYILKEIFEDGLGNLDENCSKDDLVEEFLNIKKLLK